MKKIKFIALFLCSLFLLITFTACDDSYKPKYYEHQEIPSVFSENKDMFQQIADIIIKNKSTWTDIDIDDRIIGISAETDKDQLKLIIKYCDENIERFSAQEQVALQNFFLQTRPYKDDGIALVDNQYISIAYAVKNNSTSCIGFLEYYFDRTSLLSNGVTYYDDWTRAMLSNGAVDLGNGWFYSERYK
jgi:uncharacterized lipoprotein YehR (DUF1307 family)